MNDNVETWRRIHSNADFLVRVTDRPLSGEGMTFVIHSDGRITGRFGNEKLSGSWYWDDDLFCRTAKLADEDLGVDCEIIEVRGSRMRYTRDRGNGVASIVTIGDR